MLKSDSTVQRKQFSKEHRARIGAAVRRYIAEHPDYKEAMRQRLIGHTVSAEMRENISRAQKGHPKSPEHKAKLSKSVKRAFQELGMGQMISNRMQGNDYAGGHVISPEKRTIWSERFAQAIRDGTRNGPKSDINGWFFSGKNGRLLHYRSHLELHWYEVLEADCAVCSYEIEAIVIRYVWTGVSRRYMPDIYIHLTNGSHCVMEVKPERYWKRLQNLAKWDAAQDWCEQKDDPTRFRVVGYRDLKLRKVPL